MSRCFPFPPPGYEKKARPDDENLLAKEKHKEKKHKKEKKDREKRDRKDKDRSEEKHREKKDRKEKSKDKKEKRKDRDKGEKKKTSDEKNTSLPPPQPPSLPPPPPENLADDTTEFKFLFELGKRNREDDERATESHMVQKINLTSQRRAELPNYVVESNHASAETNKFVIERREESNEKNQNQSYTKDIEIDTSVKRSSYSVSSVGVTAEKQQMEEKEKSSSSKRKHSSGESKSDKHKDKDREKKSSSKSRKREKKEKEEKTKEKKPDKDQEQIKLKETSKISDGVRNIKPLSEILGKRKEPEVNGFLHENEVRPNKLPRPATSSSNQITENGGSKAEPSRLPNSLTPPERKGVFVNNLKTNGSNLLPNPQITADNGKKTEQSVHKISPSHSNSDNKTQLQTPLSNPVLENGRKLEPCQTSSSSQWKTGIGVIRKPDKKIQNGTNGLTLSEPVVQEPVQEPVFKPPPAPVKKPPHPDSKYLSQILTVPTVESFDFDDQEWLFGNTDSRNSINIRTNSEPTPVWAEAIRVESDDITALPYVIPY
jgi:hypothetical protein